MPTTTQIDSQVKDYFKIQEIGPFISNVIDVVLALGAAMALVFMLWGAVNWIMSQGDKAKIEEARNRITAALAGLAIVAVVWLIWNLILYFFGIGTVDPQGKVTLPLPS